MNSPDPSRASPPPPPAAAAGTAGRWSSRTLLAGGREALIEHRGEFYRLRLTSSGKLILTK